MNGRDQNREGIDAAPLPKGQVERYIGKPAPEWSSDDLVELVKELGIRIVSLMHVGGDGWLKTLDFMPRSTGHLRDIIAAGERADGSSLFAGTGIKAKDSDVVLRPYISSAFLDPFSPHPTLALMCGHVDRDGIPLPESPDTIIRKADQLIRQETGTELLSLGEAEYFLGKQAEESDIYGAADKGYHAASPFVFGQTLRRKAMAILGDIGVGVKYGHSEVGYVEGKGTDNLIWEQHEIELSLASLPEAAEAMVLTQWVLRNLAHISGMRCSFDPIIRRGHAGSGQHFHFSAVRDGSHLFGLQEGEKLAEEARWLIGGLVLMGGALMAFGNRVKGSFIRLSQGKEAPNTFTWGNSDRRALIRIPVQAMSEDREVVTPPTIEFRLPDGSAHPYLVLAGVAQAMNLGRATDNLDALLERTEATYALKDLGAAAPIPRSFAEVADALELHCNSLTRGDVFPEDLITRTHERLLAEQN